MEIEDDLNNMQSDFIASSKNNYNKPSSTSKANIKHSSNSDHQSSRDNNKDGHRGSKKPKFNSQSDNKHY